jgi:hypothetical protein
MRVEVKCLEGRNWNYLPADKIKGLSIIDFLLDELTPTVAAIYDGENAVFFIANSEKYVKMMRDKGNHCFTAQDLHTLLGKKDDFRKMVAHTFPGSNVIELKPAQMQEALL